MTAGVLVVGGGIAALETAAALRALAGSRVEIRLVAPETHFEPRALSVNAPFGRQPPFSVLLTGEEQVVEIASGNPAVDLDAAVRRSAGGRAVTV